MIELSAWIISVRSVTCIITFRGKVFFSPNHRNGLILKQWWRGCAMALTFIINTINNIHKLGNSYSYDLIKDEDKWQIRSRERLYWKMGELKMRALPLAPNY